MTAAELRPAIDTVWVLVSASLIFFMQAGFALIEAGVTSARNIGNILMKNLMDFVVVAIVFYAAGFAIMFGDGNPLFGTGGWFGNGNPFSALAVAQIPIEAKLLFQLMFAAVAATIVSGAMVERTRFLPYLIACACVGLVIYPVVGHWIWGGGWLAELGFLDFAGSTVVHTTGGLTALAGAVMVGPRLSWRGTGQARRERHQRVPSTQSLYLFVLGTFILWLGWYGFNPGSTLAAVPVTALIALNTTLAGAAGALSAMLVAWVVFGRPDISMSANGALAGLVAITAGCRYVESWAALPIGAVAGSALVAGVLLADRYVDDPVGAVSVHGICGVLGTLMVGVFASPRLVADAGIGGPGLVYGGTGQFAVQVLGSATVAAYVLALAFGMFWLLKRTVGLRASRLAELEGLDVAEHGIVSADPAMRAELEALWGEHGDVIDLDEEEPAPAAGVPEDPWAAEPDVSWPPGDPGDAWPPGGRLGAPAGPDVGAVSGVDVTTDRLDPSWVTAARFIQASTGYIRADVDQFQREMGNEVLRRWRTGRGRFEPGEIRTVRFGQEAGGYSINQVEAFVHRVAAELERLVAHPSDPLVTPADIAARRLRKAAGGFAMAEVDLYLDRVADELRAMQHGRPSSLTAARLRAVRFPTALRGYAPGAVDELLAEIGREVARIQARYFGR